MWWLAGCYRKAKLLLKKKRFMEGLLANTDTQLENLQQMVDTIEFTQIEVKVVEGLKQGNEALNQLHKVYTLLCLLEYAGISLSPSPSLARSLPPSLPSSSLPSPDHVTGGC